MPATTDPNALMQQARCFDSCIPRGMQQSVFLYLLAASSHEAIGTSLDPSELAQAASCYRCIPPGQQMEVLIYLMDQILSAQ